MKVFGITLVLLTGVVGRFIVLGQRGNRAQVGTCTTNGQNLPDDTSCIIYYTCLNIGGNFVGVQSTCADCGYYDQTSGTCNAGTIADCPDIVCPTSPTTTEATTTEMTTTTSLTTTVTTSEPVTTTTTGPTTSASEATTEATTSAPTTEIVSTTTGTPWTPTCPSEGNFPVPSNCTQYYSCILFDGLWYYIMYSCAPGYYFDAPNQLCIQGQCPVTTTTTTVPGSTTTTTPAPGGSTSTTTSAPGGSTTTTPTPGIVCPAQGLFPMPGDCTSYYQCILYQGIWYYYAETCVSGYYFDVTQKLCIPGQCTNPTTSAPATTTVETTTTGSTTATTSGPTTTVSSGTTTTGSTDATTSGPTTTVSAGTTTTATTTTSAATITTVAPTTTTTRAPFTCSTAGNFPNSAICTSYYSCVLYSGTWYEFSYTCAAGYYFDAASSTCALGTC